MNFPMLWRRITATRYTRTLEAEVARLRAENRALLNSILGIAGVPPISVAEGEWKADASAMADEAELRAPAAPGDASAPGANAAVPNVKTPMGANRSRESAGPRKESGAQATPMRRRSWHQINRMLEFESAKKKAQEVKPQE